MKSRLIQENLIQKSLILLSLMLNGITCGEPFDTDQKVHQVLELNTEKQYFFNGTHYNQTIYLKYTIQEHLDPENDLLLIARPNDFKSDPDIFVSRSIEFPTPDYSEVKCWHSGLDICYIPTKFFEQSKEIYIALFSFQPYSNFTFEAKFQHRTQQMIEWNKDTVIFLGAEGETHKQSQQVVKVYVPPDDSIEHFTFSAIVDPHSRQNLTEAIKLYVMFGNETPSNSRSLWGIYSSSYGETFTSFKNQATFRTGMNYTLLIIGQTNTTVNLLCRKDTAEPVKLKFNINSDKQKTLYDAIPVGKFINYELDTGLMTRDEKTNKLNQTLLINLLVQQGNPDMYIDCDEPLRLETINRAKWVSDSNGLESLIISASEFQKQEKQCNKLFIMIYARVCAAFALEFSIRDQFADEDIVLPIYPLVTENGYVEDNQIVNYLLQMTKQTKETVTVSLAAKNGNPDLYIKKCKDANTCRVTRNELDNISSANKDDFIGLSNQIGNDYISFNHSEDNCSNSNSIFCQYLITVYANPAAGNSAPTQEIHYSLLVQYQSKHVQLYENNPLYQKLELEQFNFYSYNLVSLEGIKKVYFQVTPISGIMELIVSRYHKNPNFRENEMIACFCSNVISYSIEELSQAKQSSINFYMSVYGFSSSVYTITVYIERYQKDIDGNNDPKTSIISMKLLNDIPQKYVFETSSDYVFFDIFEKESDPIISLNPLKGEFFIEAWPLYASNALIYIPPDENSGEIVYKSQHNSAILHLNQAKQQNELKGFRVRVKKVVNREQAQFTIDYTTQVKITNLFENIPIQTFIQPDQTKFFKFTIYPDDYVVAVAYTSAHTGLIMSISGDAIHKNDANIKYETNTMSESSIYMFNAFKQECAAKAEEDRQDCVLYGMIEMSEKAQQSYTEQKQSLPTQISLIKFNRQLRAQNLQLKDGSINYYPIPSEEIKQTEFYTLNFYVHPTSFDQDMQSIATLEHGNIKMKYYVLDTSGNEMSKPNMWDKYYPTISDIEQRAIIDDSNDEVRDKQSQMININQREYLCRPKCVVLISVFVKNVKKIKQNSQLTIQVLSDIMDLTQQESVEIAGNVSHDSYQYYKVFLSQNQTIATFTAVATQSMLDINLVVFQTSNYTLQHFRPTETNCRENCRYSNLEPGNYDQIEFSPAYYGYYIIGVYGSEGYSIDYTFTWSTNQIQQIKSNQSKRTYLSQQKSFVFYADIFKNSGFKLSVAVIDEFNNNVVGEGSLSFAIYHCNSDFLKGCPIQNPEFKSIKSKDFSYDYQDICKDGIVCTIVLTFKANTNKNVVFDFLLEEIKRNNQDYIQDVISITSDQSIRSFISKDQKKRYQINLPQIINDNILYTTNYILRVQQITGIVNISLWPKDQHIYEVKDAFKTFKWIEIDSLTLLKKSHVYVDVFSCNLSQCTFDIVLYQANTPKDISKLNSVAEYLIYKKPIILTSKNEHFKNTRLIIYYENKNYDLDRKVIVIHKNGEFLQGIQIKKYYNYYIIDNLYNEKLGPSEEINVQIQLDNASADENIKNKQIPIAIFQMKLNGAQIPLIDAPQNVEEQNYGLKLNQFEEDQTTATFIIDIPSNSGTNGYHIVIDLRSCGSDLSIQGSSYLDRFEQGNFDLQIIQQSKSKSLYSLYLEDQTKVFIRISRNISQLGKKEKFLIGSYVFPQKKKYLDSPILNTQTRSGLVEIRKKQGQYILSWDMLAGSTHFNDAQKVQINTQFIFIIDNGQPKRAQKVQKCNSYQLDEYREPKQNNEAYNYTSIFIKQDHVSVDLENQLYYTTIDLEKIIKEQLPYVDLQNIDDVNLYITMKAQISPSIYGNFNQSAVWFNEVDYEVFRIDNTIFQKGYIVTQSEDSDSSNLIIVFTIILGFSLVLLGLFLYRRYRITQKKIKYEVQYREELDASEGISHSHP